VGFGWLSKERVARLLDRRPEKVEGYLMMQRILEEEGEWLWIRVKLYSASKVTFTKNSKLVVTDRNGAKVESEAVVFWPDYEQTSLYDSRRSPVVVSMHSVWRGVENTSPCGCVKFPAGSVRVGNIVSFEVVGAVVESRDEAARRERSSCLTRTGAPRE